MARTRAFFCETCGKPSTRLFGVAAGVDLTGGGVSARSSVLAYCAAHKGQVVPDFLGVLGAEGDVHLISEPPVDLRPADADAFLEWADRFMAEELGADVVEVTPDGGAPKACPHCGGELGYGVGPHVAEAAHRPNSHAWECAECGAAGMLTLTGPPPGQ